MSTYNTQCVLCSQSLERAFNSHLCYLTHIHTMTWYFFHNLLTRMMFACEIQREKHKKKPPKMMSYMFGMTCWCSKWFVDELTFTFWASGGPKRLQTLVCLKPNNQCQSIPQYFIYILLLYVFIAHYKKEEEKSNVKRQKPDSHIKATRHRTTVSPQRQIFLSVWSWLFYLFSSPTQLPSSFFYSLWFRHHSCGGPGQVPH